MRDHGGNMDTAIAHYGAGDWIDLSTGINRLPYPVPAIDPILWQRLPTASDMSALLAAASVHYACTAPVMACAGAQAAIQMIPNLGRGLARILTPTYNEHAAALRSMGWQVEEVTSLQALAGADLAIVVNPNNPDGRSFAAPDLIALLPVVGRLVVDESFGDIAPHLSTLPYAGRAGLIVLRSFGKFWGLAGLRLGLVFGDDLTIGALRAMAGPWPVAGPALQIATAAYQNPDWADATRARLSQDAARMDDLARGKGWSVVGGTDLFRLYDTPDATAAQDHLARHQIWSRIFPYSPSWIRLGPAGGPDEWVRLTAAMSA
jgi:cobalamin biosynthetic protein CobC